MAKKSAERSAAREAGLKTYHGSPCKKGHGTTRTINSECVECRRIYQREAHAKNPEKHRAKALRWKAKYPAKVASLRAKYRATKLQATASVPSP